MDVGVALEKLVSDVLDPWAGVRDVPVGLPATFRGVGVAGSWCGMGHSGGRHQTHRLPCQEEDEPTVRQRLTSRTHGHAPKFLQRLHIHVRVERLSQHIA